MLSLYLFPFSFSIFANFFYIFSFLHIFTVTRQRSLSPLTVSIFPLFHIYIFPLSLSLYLFHFGISFFPLPLHLSPTFYFSFFSAFPLCIVSLSLSFVISISILPFTSLSAFPLLSQYLYVHSPFFISPYLSPPSLSISLATSFSVHHLSGGKGSNRNCLQKELFLERLPTLQYSIQVLFFLLRVCSRYIICRIEVKMFLAAFLLIFYIVQIMHLLAKITVLKGQSHEIFCTQFFSSITSFWSH